MSNNAHAFRCGHELVRIGDHKLDVLDKCGEPATVDRRSGIRGSRLRHPYGALQLEQFEEVEIEEWIYNFGPRRFREYLRFENGILKDIEQLDYGR
ncbi:MULTISPECIES: DUF2845 domain-containing protein [Methylomonas]|uniref:DUF2845 domain-containing protein n=1 Tax=Methylomonas TaxID=416 RepID=UPI001E2A21D4|nr:DUF2845 domain-containing protein [Methylomonas rhizoryzae]